MAQNIQFLSPVGRIVQGDPFEPQTKDQMGAPLTIKTGPNAGQPTQRYFIAVAFRKDDAAFGAFYQQMVQCGRTDFPQLFDAAGNCTHPKFSWKLADGDGVDENGKPNKNKEGFAGHWVVKFNSSFPPRCFYQGKYQPHEVIQDKNAIRRGYFVRVAGTMEGNNNPTKPGLYMNLGMVELVAQGQEIVSGPDANAVFGGAPVAALPAGATPLPSALPAPGQPVVMPGAPGTPSGYIAPAAPAAPAPMPQAVAPHPGFVAGPPAAPAAPMAPTPAPAPAGPAMTAKANGFTREQLLAVGWTDDTLRANGMMV